MCAAVLTCTSSPEDSLCLDRADLTSRSHLHNRHYICIHASSNLLSALWHWPGVVPHNHCARVIDATVQASRMHSAAHWGEPGIWLA